MAKALQMMDISVQKRRKENPTLVHDLIEQTHWHNQEKLKRHTKNQHLRRRQRKTHFKKKQQKGYWFTPNLGIGEFTETRYSQLNKL